MGFVNSFFCPPFFDGLDDVFCVFEAGTGHDLFEIKMGCLERYAPFASRESTPGSKTESHFELDIVKKNPMVLAPLIES